jgi:CNT family concentrative nucleoside transporter
MDILINISRGLLGIIGLLGICYLLSADRKAIDWKLVSIGVVAQIILGVLILFVPGVSNVFDSIANGFVQILNFSEAGANFIFGDMLINGEIANIGADGAKKPLSIGYIFAFRVLPTIVFFSAFTAILYYLGILQVVIKGFAWVMSRVMGLSGPESLSMAANIFIGQTEAPLVVKPYLEKMTESEMLCLMAGGMATIAGGVFAAYMGFLGGGDEVMEAYFAKHLLTASIMSAPAAIVAAKILFPEKNKDNLSKSLDIPKQDIGENLLDAISRGTTDGVRLAVNVGAMLLVFTALLSMVNALFIGTIGDWTGWNEQVVASTGGRFEGFDFTYLLGCAFAPIAWLIGTPNVDLLVMGQLLGTKTVLNEFVAYAQLPGVELTPKSKLLATYALCGFANFASIGIQIGGISVLAPGQRKTLTEFGMRALVAGTVACLMTAAVAGMLYVV